MTSPDAFSLPITASRHPICRKPVRSEEALGVRQLRARGLRAVAGGFQQGSKVIRGRGFIASLFSGDAGIVEPVETVGAERERRTILREGKLRQMQLEQHVSQHFAGGNVHFALAHLVLQIGGIAHVLAAPRPGVRRRSCAHAAISLRSICAPVEIGVVGVAALFDLGHQGIVLREIGLRLLCMVKVPIGDGARPPGHRRILRQRAGNGLQRRRGLPIAHFQRIENGEFGAVVAGHVIPVAHPHCRHCVHAVDHG